MSKSLLIFVACAAEDRSFLADLDKHSSLLQQRSEVHLVSRHSLAPGVDVSRAVEKFIADADVILILCSADYFANAAYMREEFEPAMSRSCRSSNPPAIIPVILRSCILPSELALLQCLPKDGKPIRTREDSDQAWRELIEKMVGNYDKNRFSRKNRIRRISNTDRPSMATLMIIMLWSSLLGQERRTNYADLLTPNSYREIEFEIKTDRSTLDKRTIQKTKKQKSTANQKISPMSTVNSQRQDINYSAVRELEKLDMEKWLASVKKIP